MSSEIDRVRAWYDQLEAPRPEWDDVEIAVRLGVRDPSVAAQVIWDDREALHAAWPSVVAALAGGSDTREDSPTEPVADEVSGLAPRAAARYAALVAWRDRAHATGQFSGEFSQGLLTVAKAEQPDWKGLPRLLRDRADELREVLASVVTPEASTATEEPRDTESVPPPTQAPVAAPAELRADGFADFNFQPVPPGTHPEPRDIDFHVADDGTITYNWPPAGGDGRFRIFRVFTNDEYAAPAPLGSRVLTTTGTDAVDTRPFTTAVRHVSVWVNEGTDEASARAAQPWLYAAKACVLPIRNFLIQIDEGTVYGQWDPPDDIQRIDVLRIPEDVAEHAGDYAADYRIPTLSLTGFVDTKAEPGRTYVYRVFTFTADGQLSAPVSRTVSLDAVAQKIHDLIVHRREDGTCDMEWAQPASPGTKVEIYRAAHAPRSGIDDRVLDRDALRREGLTDDLKALPPIEVVDGRGWMRGVPWPKAWPRAYFTVVTVVDETHIQVGATAVVHRPTQVSEVAIVERVDEQLVTFVWPAGVPSVKIYQGHVGAPLVDPELQMHVAEISQEQYDRFGAIHLAEKLPPHGCDVHVVAVSYAAARPSYSHPVTVTYPGLTRISYIVEVEQPEELGGGGLFKRKASAPSTKRRIRVRSETDIEQINLRLVHNATRLPLFADDGRIMGRKSLSLLAGHPAVLTEGLDFAGQVGYVRLFAEVPPERESVTAVIDPSLSTLRCSP